MSEKAPSIFDGCKYLYAEQLRGRKVTLTIKTIQPVKIVGENGREDQGFEIAFKETPKMYAFSNKVNRKTLAELYGTEDYREYVGKRVGLFAGKSSKGAAIRFCEPEPNKEG